MRASRVIVNVMTLFLPLSQSADVGSLIVYEQERPPSPQPHPRPEPRVPRQEAPGYDQPPNRAPPDVWNAGVHDQTGHGVFSDATAAYAQPRPDPRANLGQSASYAAQQFQSQPRPPVQPPSQQAQQVPQLQFGTKVLQPYPEPDNSRAPYPQAQPQQAEAPPRHRRDKVKSRMFQWGSQRGGEHLTANHRIEDV